MCLRKYSKQYSKLRYEENYHNKVILFLFSEFFLCSLQPEIKQRGGRVAEGARLESVYMATYRGFESLPLCKEINASLKGSIFCFKA